MSAPPGEPLVFRSTDRAGYVLDDRNAPQRVRARKRPLPVQVSFAAADGIVQTLEGAVPVNAGDAIVTGLAGEQWPLALNDLSARYQPIAPTTAGTAGSYLSLPIQVYALCMHAPFTVVLRKGQAQLAGNAGDWLVDYGDGSLGIVAAAIFAATYELTESD